MGTIPYYVFIQKIKRQTSVFRQKLFVFFINNKIYSIHVIKIVMLSLNKALHRIITDIKNHSVVVLT